MASPPERGSDDPAAWPAEPQQGNNTRPARLPASHPGHDVGRLGKPIIVVVSCRVREVSKQGIGKNIVQASRTKGEMLRGSCSLTRKLVGNGIKGEVCEADDDGIFSSNIAGRKTYVLEI